MSEPGFDWLDVGAVRAVDEILSVVAGITGGNPCMVLTTRIGGAVAPELLAMSLPHARRLVNDLNHVFNTSPTVREAERTPGYDPGPLLPPYWLSHGE